MSTGKKLTQLGRMFLLIEVLAPHVVSGLSVSEMSRATHISAPNVCRDMDALAAEGMTHKLESGRWSLTARPLCAYRAYDFARQAHSRRQDDFNSNVDAGAHRLMP